MISLAIIGIWYMGLFYAFGQPPKGASVEFGDDYAWVLINHESGSDYILRTSQIAGFMQPVPGDPKERNAILMANGKYLMTTLDLDVFTAMLESDKHGVKEIKAK